MKEDVTSYFTRWQKEVIGALQEREPAVNFGRDEWRRLPHLAEDNGGGITCVLSNGAVFEQAAVNFSRVFGAMEREMAEKLGHTSGAESAPFFAAGVSIIVHPRSPLVPTTHCNFRYLELDGARWFGGGMDLTPYYLFEEDVAAYHSALKKICDRHDPSYYTRFKNWCDEYFYLPHRGESRGVGGLFFDYLGRDDPSILPSIFGFIRDLSDSFCRIYLPHLLKHQHEAYGEAERRFQLLRRGRYVEFNLLYDRGTLFGLRTNGRTESILASLPPAVAWEYSYEPETGSREAALLNVLRTPRAWV